MINTCTKFEFNPSTSWGSYARHRHNLLHGARSTTDIKPWHKHTTGELKNAKYTSPDIVGEFVTVMAENTEEAMLEEVRNSPVFAGLIDEGTAPKAVKKMLGMCVKYIGPNGLPEVKYMKNMELMNGTAETTESKITEHFNTKAISITKMAALGSDGASVMLGNKDGVAAKLQKKSKCLIAIHCCNHRLALAARDSFKETEQMVAVEELMDNLYNFYHWSPNRSNSLHKVQEVFDEAPLSIKQAKHFRWLSFDSAVESVRMSYKSLLLDLEHLASSKRDITESAKASGIRKKLLSYQNLYIIHMLSDVLPKLCSLSVVFQRKEVNLAEVKPIMSQTCEELRGIRSGQQGVHLGKVEKAAEQFKIVVSHQEKQKMESVKDKFISAVLQNLEDRLKQPEIVNCLAKLDLTNVERDMITFYGMTEITILAEYFHLDDDSLLDEWDRFKSFILRESQESTIPHAADIIGLAAFLSKGESFRSVFPMMYKLYSTAAVLPVSTAEVERLFSAMKLVYTDHRSSLKVPTVDKLLQIKLNVNDSFPYKEVAAKWYKMKKRRI